MSCGSPYRHSDVQPRARGGLLSGSIVTLLCGLLCGCGAPPDVGSSGTIVIATVGALTSDEASVVTATSPTTSQSTSTVVPVTSTELKFDDVATTTTAVGHDMVTTQPLPTVVQPAIADASVRALAAVLGIDGQLEQRDAEHGPGQCIGRLEPRGLCVNVPLWGTWQYWDTDAQRGPGASNDQARSIAGDLFAHLRVDPGAVISVEPNGPLPQVEFSTGARVMVAADGRIAMVIASTSLLPAS